MLAEDHQLRTPIAVAHKASVEIRFNCGRTSSPDLLAQKGTSDPLASVYRNNHSSVASSPAPIPCRLPLVALDSCDARAFATNQIGSFETYTLRVKCDTSGPTSVAVLGRTGRAARPVLALAQALGCDGLCPPLRAFSLRCYNYSAQDALYSSTTGPQHNGNGTITTFS